MSYGGSTQQKYAAPVRQNPVNLGALSMVQAPKEIKSETPIKTESSIPTEESSEQNSGFGMGGAGYAAVAAAVSANNAKNNIGTGNNAYGGANTVKPVENNTTETTPTGGNSYQNQAVLTMTQGELLILLFDELLKRLGRAELSLKIKKYDVFDESIDRVDAIIKHLRLSLNRDYDISKNLDALYEYFIYTLIRVKSGRNLELIQDIKPHLVELRDSFKIAAENTAEAAKTLESVDAAKAVSNAKAVDDDEEEDEVSPEDLEGTRLY